IVGDRAYIRYIDHKMTFSSLPSTYGIHYNFRMAIKYLIFLLEDFNTLFALNHDTELTTIKEKFASHPEPEQVVLNPATAATLDQEKIIIQFETDR
ncbi:MAG: hypothetical protein KC713_04700, partial [Candidatus Omnitrophica bacterium]|nr:hypothetical protein [Candidatus Omnitrophota bacterium]